MPITISDHEDVGEIARELYVSSIQSKVDTPENVGRMVIIDVETGEYGVDDTGLETAHRLHIVRPNARLFGIRIGYDVADTIGGVMERTA